jgi:hypothetical protein
VTIAEQFAVTTSHELNAEIFVRLANEDVRVWRPVIARQINGRKYLIVLQDYPREIETWEFEPGEIVICETVEAFDGPILAAIRKA